MERWQQRLFVIVFTGLFVIALISQAKRETLYSRRLHQRYVQPFIDAQLYGVVVEVRDKSFDLNNIVYWSNAKEFVCQDLETNGLDGYDVGWDEPIHAGDTIQKSKGQNWFLLIRPNGKIYHSYPIDRR